MFSFNVLSEGKGVGWCVCVGGGVGGVLGGGVCGGGGGLLKSGSPSLTLGLNPDIYHI